MINRQQEIRVLLLGLNSDKNPREEIETYLKSLGVLLFAFSLVCSILLSFALNRNN